MVQGAPQVAGRFPEEMRMYKAPPPGDLLRAVLRDRPSARVRARLLDPDGRPAADRAGPARARRRPLGPGAARVHARLQPLVHARDPVRAAAAPRQPGDRRCRASPTATALPVARMDYSQCDNDRKNIAFAKQTLHDIFEAGGAEDVLVDRPLRPSRRRLPDGLGPRAERRRRRPPRAGRYRTCSSPTAA